MLYEVILSYAPGADFGDKNCVRINFGCPRSELERAIELIKAGCQAHIKS